MKILTVDFTNDVPVISTRYGGELGEHQAVSLNIIPEKSMTEDEDLQFYYVLFKVDGGLVASRTFSQGEDIEIALWGQLTENRRLSFQLIGTNGTETIIAKTPILTLSLGDSLVGTVIGIDDNRDSLIAMIGAFNERLDDDEEKLNTIETGAEVNAIEQINDMDGNPLSVIGKAVTLPTVPPLEIRNSTTKLNYEMSYIKSEFDKGRQIVFGGLSVLRIVYNYNSDSKFLVLDQAGKLTEYKVPAGTTTYSVYGLQHYMADEMGAEHNKIEKIKTADGTELTPTGARIVTLPDYALKVNLAIDITGMTGNEIRTAWNNNQILKYDGNLIISVQDYTYNNVSGVLVERSKYYYAKNDNQAVFIFAFIPNTNTTITPMSGLTRVGVSIVERTDGAIIENNQGFIKGGQLAPKFQNYYTRTEVDSLISSLSGVSIEVVQTLPTENIKTNVIYLVPKTGSTNDVYDEYMYINNAWEHIGSTDVDLSNYYTKTEIDNKGYATQTWVGQQGYLTSLPTASTSTLGGVKVDGTSITINDGVISAQGGGGASAMIVTFTTENDNLVSDYTIHEIVTAHNSGSVVLGKMMDEDAGIEFVFNLSAAIEVEGIALAEFTSMFDSGDDAIIVSVLGINEGEGDTWQGIYRAIPEEITTTTSVSQYSTDDEVPTAKAVYDAIKPDFVVTAVGNDYLKGEMTGGLSVTLTTSKTLTELLAKAAAHKELDVKGTIYVEDPDPDYAEEGVFDVQKYDLWYYRYGTADYINYLLEELNSEDTTARPGIALVFQHTFPRGSNKNVSFDRYAAWAVIVYESESSPGTISYEYTDDLSNLL